MGTTTHSVFHSEVSRKQDTETGWISWQLKNVELLLPSDNGAAPGQSSSEASQCQLQGMQTSSGQSALLGIGSADTSSTQGSAAVDMPSGSWKALSSNIVQVIATKPEI